MIIGLMGFEFDSPNKGCEALGYSFISCLIDILDNNFMIYNFSNKGEGLVKEIFPQIKFENINLKIKDMHFTMVNKMSKCDYIFDVTLGDSFSDIYSEQYCLNDIKFKRLAQLFGKNYILLPQTYGPFNDEKVRKRAIKVLKKSQYIFCRDKISQDYISGLGIKDSYLTTDIAFFLPYEKRKYEFDKNKINVGINVSGLLWQGGFNSNNQFHLKLNYENFIKQLIEIFGEDKDICIYLIPHVIDEGINAHDDDYKIIKELNNNNNNLIIAPKFKTPIEAKSFISMMDFFVGSRMHSTIAAFSCGIPTVPVSYSRKFEGLFNTLDYDYVIHGTSDTTDIAVKKVVEYFHKRFEIRSEIVNKDGLITLNKYKFIEELKVILEV